MRVAVCASQALPVQSPAAQMPGTFVAQRSSTLIPRWSKSRRNSSRPSPLTFGMRPVETSTMSRATDSGLPSFSKRTVSAVISRTFAPVWNVTFFLLSSPRRFFVKSLSICGQISGSISITVTGTPTLPKKHANSQPITPPPMITTLLGSFSRFRIPVESRTPGRPHPGIGGLAGEEPVLIRMFFAW